MNCIRESSGMCDPSLKKVFLGKQTKMEEYTRVEAAIAENVTDSEFYSLMQAIALLKVAFFRDSGTEFLDEQRRLHTPKRKSSKKK